MSAPKSPGSTRTSRNRALEIGTESSGFGQSMPYEHGVPAERSGGTYQDNVHGVVDPGAPVNPSPFKIGQ